MVSVFFLLMELPDSTRGYVYQKASSWKRGTSQEFFLHGYWHLGLGNHLKVLPSISATHHGTSTLPRNGSSLRSFWSFWEHFKSSD